MAINRHQIESVSVNAFVEWFGNHLADQYLLDTFQPKREGSQEIKAFPAWLSDRIASEPNLNFLLFTVRFYAKGNPLLDAEFYFEDASIGTDLVALRDKIRLHLTLTSADDSLSSRITEETEWNFPGSRMEIPTQIERDQSQLPIQGNQTSASQQPTTVEESKPLQPAKTKKRRGSKPSYPPEKQREIVELWLSVERQGIRQADYVKQWLIDTRTLRRYIKAYQNEES